ncbi:MULTISPECIES: hypothetical protein [unclassified Aureispira]|uniref:hypothetical protein n=1 Tax=unclassified Aureispira TaxID=2649989 RepID=UPI0012DC786F|nr:MULTISPECIES: hypothetical protein [unclassified Aureispira]WMX15823.1 hypothetical protein QP953_05420 [Aureispira sp. CCB-E]
MTTTKHKITAFSLAFLVLISTTGIGLNIMLCNCTGVQYLAILASKMNLECCKEKLAAAKKNCCTNSKTIQQDNFDSPTIMAEKECCSSSFKYAKANINLELVKEIPLPTTSFVHTFWVPSKVLPYTEPLLLPQNVACSNTSNKAPPRFKESILNWFQVYRC